MDVEMRRSGIVSALVVAVALGFCCDESWARDQGPYVAQSLSSGADPAQLQSAVWAWIVATAGSTPFMVGAAAGIIVAEAGRCIWRWIWRILGGATQAAHFLVHHRLLVVCTSLAACYAAVRLIG